MKRFFYGALCGELRWPPVRSTAGKQGDPGVLISGMSEEADPNRMKYKKGMTFVEQVGEEGAGPTGNAYKYGIKTPNQMRSGRGNTGLTDK